MIEITAVEESRKDDTTESSGNERAGSSGTTVRANSNAMFYEAAKRGTKMGGVRINLITRK